ncbi:hypothetical protein GCM10008018_60980 [Paenibacillus marchantiophytorum]|uniref:LSM domain-containing protein n=1 Tax=Paenibacillus marchantiophytorum TaxID=1619310 RepID=A0ABQ1FCI9_9BACL|nr:hypothetical protein [Paenibacillus marchantiophytorum]GGA06954.1 hypothetical protein GCM10008018_60980 [Paenibacillus marchantiophytorum]
MQPIHPITEKSCRSFCGKPVLIYLTNGSEIYGVLSRLEKNSLILNEETRPKLSSTAKKVKPSKSVKTKQAKSTSHNPSPNPIPTGFSSFGLPLFGGAAQAPLGALNIPLSQVSAIFSP